MLWKAIIYLLKKRHYIRLIKIGSTYYKVEISKYASTVNELEKWKSALGRNTQDTVD